MRQWQLTVTAVVCVVAPTIAWYVLGVDGLNVVGTIASIVGLAISVYVALAVGDIRRRYVSHAMLSIGLQRLEAHRNNLSLGMRKKDFRKIRQSLSSCKGLLIGLRLHLPLDFDVPSLALMVDGLVATKQDENLLLQMNLFVSSLDAFAERFRTHVLELEWGGHDG